MVAYFKNVVLTLEVVPKRFNRFVSVMRGMFYYQPFKKSDLYSLEFRSMGSDLIETYKMLRRHGRVDIEMIPLVRQDQT